MEQVGKSVIASCVTLLTVAILFLMIAIPLVKVICVDRPFDKEVHGHVVNAYWSNTPELMIQELQMALNGMDNLSINGNDYGAFFDWDKTPDTKVDYWIKHFESIIERCNAVMLWRDAAYSNGSTPESLGDVYEQKMDNLRKFIKSEGWSDEVFRDAYVVKYHLWARFFWPIEIICGIIPLLLMSILSFSVWAWACKRPSGYY